MTEILPPGVLHGKEYLLDDHRSLDIGQSRVAPDAQFIAAHAQHVGRHVDPISRIIRDWLQQQRVVQAQTDQAVGVNPWVTMLSLNRALVSAPSSAWEIGCSSTAKPRRGRAVVQMTKSQVEAFLAVPRYAVFATNSPDGPPRLSTVWFLYDGGDLFFDIERRSVKYRNIIRDPRVTVCIDGEHPDGRTVVVSGKAAVSEKGNPEVDEIARRMVRRYHESEEDALRYEADIAGLDTVIIKVTPERTIALDYSAQSTG